MQTSTTEIAIRAFIGIIFSTTAGALLVKYGITLESSVALVLPLVAFVESVLHRNQLKNECPPPSGSLNAAGINMFAGPAPVRPRVETALDHFFVALFGGAVIACILLLFSGCQASPGERIALAEDSLNAAVTTINTEYDAKHITLAQVKAVRPYADAATDGLFAAENAHNTGDDKTADQLLAGAIAAIEKLDIAKLKPATQPTTKP